MAGDEQIASAAEIGFSVTQRLHSPRIEGDNEPAVCAKVTKALGDARINLRGLSAAVIGPRFIVNIALDTLEDADKATELLQAL